MREKIPLTELLAMIGNAIALFEGYFLTDSLAKKNNNPGNLRSWEGYPTESGYVKFPDPATGWKKLYVQIGKYISRGHSLKTMMAMYSPAADHNDPEHYARFIMTKLRAANVEVSLDTKLADLVDRSAS